MLEKQKGWKREAGLDRIKITVEMDVLRFRAGFDSEPFYAKLYNPRWSPTPVGYKLKMDVNVEISRMEILLLQPPQCDSSPRRMPAVGAWLNKPGTPHAESQSTERK